MASRPKERSRPPASGKIARSTPAPRAPAAAARFLASGFGRWLKKHAPASGRAGRARARVADLGIVLGVVPPRELERFLAQLAGRTIADFHPRTGEAPDFAAEVAGARRAKAPRARLASLLAGAVPFGSTRSGDLWIHVGGDTSSPGRGVVAALDPEVPTAPRLVCRGMGAFALMCTVHGSRTEPPAPLGVAEQEAVRTAFERARDVLLLLVGSDAEVRRAAKKLAPRPLDVPPAPRARARDRSTPLALGAVVEAFFREEEDALAEALDVHARSGDAFVAGAAKVLASALERPKGATEKELARRRAVALRAVRSQARTPRPGSGDALRVTRRIIGHLDATRPTGDTLVTTDAREESLLALGEIGDRSVVPVLVARAVTGDISAVEMLGALGDGRAIPHLRTLLRRTPARQRQLETAVVRALASLGAAQAAPALRELLAENPMPSWREGIERGALVKELVTALGTLADEGAGSVLVDVLAATSQEYRAILPTAAWALGRIEHLPALPRLADLLTSPKEPVTCEAIWAVGAIARAHPSARERAAALLEGLKNLEPGAEIVRMTALVKLQEGAEGAPRPADLRRALEKALWDPGFRQEETSRRRTWALTSLEELAAYGTKTKKREDGGALFLGHEAVRYLVTRDDHRVRRTAEQAFAAWRIQVPTTRRYYTYVVDELHRRGGLEALHDAVRDSLGVFRHNVATRLAELGDPASIRPLAEATARLFAEPPTSTYEYDDAPAHLVAFVRALAKLNRPEGNDVLIDGLRTGNHQVRAVVAENAPDDERFVPELMAMLGDPRSFLRSRAERSLAALGIRSHQSDAPPRPLHV